MKSRMRLLSHFLLVCGLFILTGTKACAAQPKLYIWVPFLNYGGFHTEHSNGLLTKNSRASGWGCGLFGVHYHFYKELAVIIEGYGLNAYEKGDKEAYRTGGWNALLKYSPTPMGATLFSKVFQVYVQTGVWHTKANKERSYYGSGIAVGGGVYCHMTPWMYVDCSGKRLFSTPFITSDLKNNYRFTLGIGFSPLIIKSWPTLK
jgi:hypothetical protein